MGVSVVVKAVDVCTKRIHSILFNRQKCERTLRSDADQNAPPFNAITSAVGIEFSLKRLKQTDDEHCRHSMGPSSITDVI